ncbi:acetolactate synthase [Amycolatopsis antarctica]|uniref:Acetolactate synthase n=1 Tax=Amycolatopsis antarctica TaxID=1854586 RepID=A0A263CXW6_9PSEU|nr:thiamine pyrophosphate-binding protein [Amycolatopsis antarctica]OZM70994.1 acetolactate synthase [Amycolatopsis antarctica]
MRLADALVATLRDWDTRYVFGVSGANIEHVHDAIHRLGAGRLESVLARREDGAAFMADARARVHRTLGVCCSTSGGGMMNLAVGLAESYAESVPVLALIGQPPSSMDGRGAFQDSSGIGRTVDAAGMLAAFTKYVARPGVATFWDDLRAAVHAALTGRPGPVALLLPRDVQDSDIGPAPDGFPSSLTDFLDRPAVPEDEVRALFDVVRSARRPVLLVGHGVRRGGDPGAVTRFAQAAGVPTATTMSARAEFPNEDPLFLGVAGLPGHPSAHEAIRDADLVVVAGAGLNAMTRGPLGELPGGQVAVVNIDPGEAQRSVAPRLVVRADAGAVFERLLEMTRAEPFAVPENAARPRRRFVPRLAEPVPGRENPGNDGDDLRQSEAVEVLRDYLPAGGHLVLDAGNCASAAIHLSDVPPGASSTIALGMGGMGYSLPAAVGAQLGSDPGTRTVVLCGDGAFLMNGLELHTAVELGLPVLFVVFNNAMHGMCVTRQQVLFDSRLEAVKYAPVDVTGVARGLGTPDRLWVGGAGTLTELRERLADYHQRHLAGPGVLELRLAIEEVPPFTTLLPADEPTAVVERVAVHGACR